MTSDQITLSAEFTRNKQRLDHNLTEMKVSLAKFASCLRDIHKSQCWKIHGLPYEDFDAFVRQELGIGKSRAYQIMNAQEVRLALADEVKHDPEISTVVENMNEVQLREVSNIEPAKAVEIITQVASEGKITAKKIREKIKPSTPSETLKQVCPHCGKNF
jgi:hypothetical protein